MVHYIDFSKNDSYKHGVYMNMSTVPIYCHPLDSQSFTRHFSILLLCRFIISFYIVYFNSNKQKCKDTFGFMSLDLCLI